MKKNICIGVILVIFGFHFNGYAQVDHSQSVHRHIVQQAWRLLHSTNPCFYNNTELKTFIGTSETDGPWSFNNTGRVVAGAFREDDEDVIWNFCCPNVWPFVFVYSTSHFWYAPDPNSPGEQYSLSDWCGLVPWYCHPPGTNWHRLRNYILGGWFLNKQYSGYPSDVTFQRWDGQGTYRIISYGPISFSYQGLVEDENGGNTKDLYHTGYMKIMGYWLSPDMWQSLNPPLEIRIVDGSNKYFCYEILGRMSHCLSDMSVPAHTHLDPHPSECWDGDSYEEYWFADYLAKYSYYNAGGSYINPFVQSEFHPVYYLAFLMTQVAGHFPSNDCDRYSNIYSSPPFQIVGQILQNSPSWGTDIFSAHGWLGLKYDKFITIANYCMKTAIRANSGLFYWFASKTGQVDVGSPPTNMRIISNNLIGDPNTLSYTLYKGQTGRITAMADGAESWTSHFRICEQSEWHWRPFEGYGLYTDCPVANANYFYIQNNTYSNSNCPSEDIMAPGGLYIKTWIIAQNSQGCLYTPDIKISLSQENLTGCPYIFVKNTDVNYEPDNNILHRSELPQNQGVDVTDLYKLRIEPFIIDDQIFIQVAEMDNDISYFDQFKLHAIDHPIGTKIAITENNDIVMIDSVTVLSTDYADLNGIDITENVQFHEPQRGPVLGDTLDHVYSYFEPRSVNNAGIIMELQGDHIIKPYPVPKAADHLIIGTENGNIDGYFSHRENTTITVIPIESPGEGSVVNSVDVDWYRNFDIRYIAIANLSYSGFTLSELPFIEASHSINGDVLSYLTNDDSIYVLLDTTAIISLKFSTASIEEPGPNVLREYILETNGRYIKGSQYGFSQPLNVVNPQSNPFSYKLYINYPNPFNPKTTIKYEIAKSGLVKINVYDILGRLVTTLVNENKAPGSYNAVFDGSSLASGVYIYRMESGDFTDVKKMVLIK